MATILLSAVGAALGSGFGGSILGLSGAVIGRAVGAAAGRSLDQRLLGAGSEAVEVGKVDRFRVSGVGYGTPIQEIWGRMRVAGEIIWASRFQEQRQQSGGGKGAPRSTSTSFTYSVSLAIALCRGEALRVGRIWADGVEISANSIDLRFYPGSEDQLPDPKIEAVEGEGIAPAYRGISYVVIENLALSRFGNRVPQFSFEVVRRAKVAASTGPRDLVDAIKAVALIPGSGEYALATTPVHFNHGPGQNITANVHSVLGETDFANSLRQLNEELPNCESVSLVVSWFGNDLRCGFCQVQPKVEQKVNEGVGMPWIVSGTPRALAEIVPASDGRSIYGGTPSDRSVIEAIQAIRASGKEVMFYPFILMDQLEDNGLPDPWSDEQDQPILPWRGRISLSRAPGQSGSVDQTIAAEMEIEAFLGNASPNEFSTSQYSVTFSGAPEWSYRRFILHYAHLCALAGGVEAFCIGSELRGLTRIRSSVNEFPMVQALKTLAAEVRAILGSTAKITYAADWSEYFGLQTDGDVFFNLDPLWTDPNIDFIGIDNYMPISDWRDGPTNRDAIWGSIYNLDYLEANISGGEGYDWHYDSAEAEANQTRFPISDGDYGEDWVFRYKDLKGWWSNSHHERISGVRQTAATDWVPGMKPIRFTEYGCAALDKSTNQPNRFIDSKSSESSLPRGSSGLRDDFLQNQYYLAMGRYWSSPSNNPPADLYAGRMVDFDRSHAWAWDTRPFPDFPGNLAEWSDGPNYPKGHWLNGRTSNQPIALVASEICASTGLVAIPDVANLHGTLHGYASNEVVTSRSKLQSLSLVFGFDVVERNGSIRLFNRGASCTFELDEKNFVALQREPESHGQIRLAELESVSRVRLTYIEAENDFDVQTVEAVFPDDRYGGAVEAEVLLQLTAQEANAFVERSLIETRLARDKIRMSLPRSLVGINTGDVVQIASRSYRVDRIDAFDSVKLEAVRIDNGSYARFSERGGMPVRALSVPTTPAFSIFMDLPLLRGDEVPHAPHIAIAAAPWPGSVSVWSSSTDSGYTHNTETNTPAIIGTTQTEFLSAVPGLWDRGSVLRISVPFGEVSSASVLDVLNGANVAVIGDGSAETWEVIQFSQANLIGPNTYELKLFLRGLAGSDAITPASWPAGSVFILLDGLVPQINMPFAVRGLDRYYRIGATDRGYTDASVDARVAAFNGIGLRPYSVAHLSYQRDSIDNLMLSWIRRTRIDGDSWQSMEVPLSEESESYTVQVLSGNTVIRHFVVPNSSWTYTAAMQADDQVSGPFEVLVAQNSSGFGQGPYKPLIIA